MDNLTHGLAGLVIGAARPLDAPPDPKTGLPTRSDTDRGVLWGTLLASEAPDIDVLFPFLMGGGQAAGFKYHRGITHSLPGILLLSAAVTLLVRLFLPKARVAAVFAWSLTSMLIAHIFLDLLTSYGTRVLLPWSDERLAWDILMIVDPFVTVPMGIAAIYGRYRPLLRRRTLMAAAAFVMLYIGARTWIHQDLNSQIAREMASQGQLVRSGVLPGLIGLTGWNYIAEFEDRYVTGSVSYPYRKSSQEEHRKIREDEVIRAASADRDVREFLKFASYPQFSYERTQDGYRLLVTDLRYRFGGRNAFGALVLLDNNLNVVRVNLRHGGLRGPDSRG